MSLVQRLKVAIGLDYPPDYYETMAALDASRLALHEAQAKWYARMMAHSIRADWPFGTVVQVKGDPFGSRWMMLTAQSAVCLGESVRGNIIPLSEGDLKAMEPVPEPEP